MRNPQLPAPRAFQLAHQDRLHGLRPPVLAVLPTAAFGRADAQEVGRAQARPVIPLVVPADPALARRHPQRGGGKSRRTEPAMRRADEVADLAARKSRHPVRMLARNQRVPQRPVRSVRDHDDLKIPYPRRMRRHRFGFGDIGLELARPVPDRRRPRRRKDNAGNPLGQCAERLHAASKLRASAHVEKRELLADPPAQGGPAVELFLRQDRRYPRNRRLVAQCAAYLRLCHATEISCGDSLVQGFFYELGRACLLEPLWACGPLAGGTPALPGKPAPRRGILSCDRVVNPTMRVWRAGMTARSEVATAGVRAVSARCHFREPRCHFRELRCHFREPRCHFREPACE